ncbi:MAG: hypothetical protein ACI4TC_02235 [Kiritimatiellia bacterium]
MATKKKSTKKPAPQEPQEATQETDAQKMNEETPATDEAQDDQETPPEAHAEETTEETPPAEEAAPAFKCKHCGGEVVFAGPEGTCQKCGAIIYKFA